MSAVATHPTYEELCASLDWALAERELGIVPGGAVNIGAHCSDRLCALGLGSKKALVWEDFAGRGETFTFDDLRLLSNSAAAFLDSLGLEPGNRVCLFMDRIPELYIGFLAVLKMGGIVQPLFSAFGEDSLLTRLANAGTSAIVTQRKHLPKVRKIRDRLPELTRIVVVDAGEPTPPPP
jgi:acetyl-CoA synthetase